MNGSRSMGERPLLFMDASRDADFGAKRSIRIPITRDSLLEKIVMVATSCNASFLNSNNL